MKMRSLSVTLLTVVLVSSSAARAEIYFDCVIRYVRTEPDKQTAPHSPFRITESKKTWALDGRWVEFQAHDGMFYDDMDWRTADRQEWFNGDVVISFIPGKIYPFVEVSGCVKKSTEPKKSESDKKTAKDIVETPGSPDSLRTAAPPAR